MINVAVIGTGNMGRHHVRVYSEMESCNLVSIAEKDEKTGQELAKKNGCRYYNDYREMLEKESIDAVSIVVPTTYHKEIALECMKKVKAILIEKPIAMNLEDAHQIVDKAKEHGTRLMIGHIERFNPAVRKLKEIINSGGIGEITSLNCKRVGLFPPRMQDANVVLDLAVHDIDVCSFLLGKTPKEVFSVSGRAINSSREDYADIFIKYEGSQSLFIQVNWLTPVKIRGLQITGTKGYVELNYVTQELILYKTFYENGESNFEKFVKETTPKKEIIQIEKREPLKEELKHFLSFAHGEECLSSGEDGLDALRVALSAIESNKENKVIKIG
ncbi:MAG: Gfo/Idh/MocA family oxidoreductase [Candidatus Aenigmatarchaeota archaeon]|nr:Gfo/Idh/MocA family oxidoreductase [Nanoarchaeota archaeon]